MSQWLQIRPLIDEMVNRQFDTAEFKKLFAVPLTPGRVKVYQNHMTFYAANRRDCWSFVAGKAPLDVKRAIWEHEKDELIHDQRMGRAHVTEEDLQAGDEVDRSLSGLLGNFGQGNYASAKGGIYSLTRTASMEFQRMGVTVNAIAPVALTRMTQDLAMFKGMTPEQIGPQYVAPVAAFLASDLAADITGMIVGVQGPKVFLYKMTETAGVTREGGPWSPAEIKERWAEISR